MVNLVVNGGVDIAATCGGCCSCATCHVYVEDSWKKKTGEPSAPELELLESSGHYKPGNSRLACQISMEDGLNGLVVAVAPEE